MLPRDHPFVVFAGPGAHVPDKRISGEIAKRTSPPKVAHS